MNDLDIILKMVADKPGYTGCDSKQANLRDLFKFKFSNAPNFLDF